MRRPVGRVSAPASRRVALAILATAGLLLGAAEPGPPSYYLFTSFRGNGEDGLHLAWSRDGYFVYFDHYANPPYYGAVKSKDLKAWVDVSKEMSFPPGCRHGTVLAVSKEIIDGLLAATPDAGKQP